MTFELELDQPLTGEDFQFLDRFLSSTAVCSDAMDIVTLQGFLAAVLSGPSLIMPSAIFQWIWDARQGTRQPRFLSAGRERKVAALIVQFWNDMVRVNKVSHR